MATMTLLIALIVLGSCILYYSIINSIINCESFQVITLEVTTLGFVSKNIAKFRKLRKYLNLSDNRIIVKCVKVALRPTFYTYCRRNKPWNDPELLNFYCLYYCLECSENGPAVSLQRSEYCNIYVRDCYYKTRFSLFKKIIIVLYVSIIMLFSFDLSSY
jgi:hypothetical protein